MVSPTAILQLPFQFDMSEYGPELPPELAKSKNFPDVSEIIPKKARVIGPSLPPPEFLNRIGVAGPPVKEFIAPTDENSDDEFDGFGPMIPKEGIKLSKEEELQLKIDEIEARTNRINNEVKEKKPERPEWMTLPPERGMKAPVGPEMKGRTFSKTQVSTSDTSDWTDSPEERAAKILGKESKRKRKDDEVHEMTPKEKELAKYVEKYNKTSRPKSLMETHLSQTGGKPRDSTTDDPSSRPFDRDKDLVQRRIDPKERRKLLEDAKGLGGKFSHGKSTFL
ncbi:hypothetical protein HK096_008168 [Nowakowskiella sp. JEL0078]|nr:hypothetical protein HK096_008168 [Nowakowskiella sp. JEL0078]